MSSAVLTPPITTSERKQFDFHRQQKYPARLLGRKGVTVCIASICDAGNREKAIVAVSDSKISTGYTSSDRAALKNYRVSKAWSLMYAAENVSPIVPIAERLRKDLRTTPNELREVASAVQKAYQEQIQVKAADHNMIPQETALGASLLMYGYDDHSRAHVFTVSDPNGQATFEDITGFQAIGSGGIVASTMLYFYGQRASTPLAMGIYFALAAKFMAESASDVGRDTSVQIFKPNGDIVILVDPQIDAIRAMWDYDGKPRIPINCAERISTLYTESEKLTEQALNELGLHQGWKDD